MSSPSVVCDPLYLILGDEELLVERALWEAVGAARAADPETELRRIKVSELTPPELDELLSPSLFAEGRVVALEAAQDAGKEIAEAILSHARQPADGVVLVIVHSGGGRGKNAKELPSALRKLNARVTECNKITKGPQREAFVKDEVRRAGGRIDAAGVGALIETVGFDLRELSSAASQLVADTGGKIDESEVRRYHRGRAEVTGFVVAEKAVTGDLAGALEALRWALQLGVAHVLIADALADSVRTIGRVAAYGRGDPFRLAGDLGMPAWKVKKAQAQARGWSSATVAEALRAVAVLNADVKGMAADADHALERTVLRLVELHSSRN
ncbi:MULTISPECIES: DNA polymerase III subunit delta [unclassified Saccharopolyspora]|uniref:DNA polymerase III subunit delta n=1 Tax=unclassified Saccharopolyspora TaxID=2646250 RepID=UPI001CD56EF6|nr:MULTISPECIES: DNA polymerase III subunit delta [unclassified Saccharopolyspora]MCA1189190.1 DNA polymerase III subunit delta [Saccharopolyspora sp. 6T]MCA1228457.1 DNA polymerase III subunit delta [Saccharopolyspora sp. 6M]MCA1282647.1 DNA polymerase III subunit delta [Saccharopolyspora sp. 7B]